MASEPCTLEPKVWVEELLKNQLPPPSRRRRIREDARVSARRMATAMGVAVSTLLRWEEGATPHPEHAQRYREFLDALEEVSR